MSDNPLSAAWNWLNERAREANRRNPLFVQGPQGNLQLGPGAAPVTTLTLGMAGTTPAEDFWDAFDAAHTASKLNSVSHVHLFQHGPDEMEISHIQVDPSKRGQGIGNRLMQMLTDLADQHGVTLHASPASDADSAAGLGPGALREWYQNWGFDEPGGGDRLTRRPYGNDE